MRQREREEEQRKEDDRLEAIEVRREAAEFAEKLRLKAEARREICVKQAVEHKRQMEDVEVMKEIDRTQEEVVGMTLCRRRLKI